MARPPNRLQSALGWQGMSGAVLLACAAIFNALLLAPIEEQLAAASSKAEALQQQKNDQQMQRVALETPAAMLDQFYAFFSAGENITDELSKLYNLAQANGVELRQGEYKLLELKESRLKEYQISLPVKGNYAKIRLFAAHALANIPVLSLDRINFQRKKSGESAVEAEIVFTLYLLNT